MATTSVPVRQVAPAPADASEPFSTFRGEIDRLFDRFMGGFGAVSSFRTATGAGAPAPAVDIAEDAASFRLAAELPGLSEKDIQVQVSGDALASKGQKRRDSEESGGHYRLAERSYGRLQRRFQLPEGVDRERVVADGTNGALTVTLPNTAESAPKTVEIRSAV